MPISMSRQRVRVIMVVAAVMLVLYILWTARSALTPFLLGAVFVLVFAPVVDAVARAMPFQPQHPDLALSLGIGLLYIALVSVAVTIGAVWAPRAIGDVKDLANGLPALVERIQHEVQDNNGWYQKNVPPDIRVQVDQNWRQVASKAGEFGQNAVSRIVNFATSSVATVVSFLVTPFWAFFVLKDRRKGARYFVGLFPESVQPDVEHLITNAHTVFGSYMRAQLVLSSVTGVVTAVGLTMFGVRFSLALGVVAGVANLIPVLGPMIGGIPALIVVAATHPGWQVLWVFLFLFGSQELKDFVLVPRIQGGAVRIHPAVILVLIVVAGHIAGFWGLLFAVPVAAVLRDSFVYVYRRLGSRPEATSEAPSPSPEEPRVAAAGEGARSAGSWLRPVRSPREPKSSDV